MVLCRIVENWDIFYRQTLTYTGTDTDEGIEDNLTLKTYCAWKKMSYSLKLYTYKVDQHDRCVLYRIHSYWWWHSNQQHTHQHNKDQMQKDLCGLWCPLVSTITTNMSEHTECCVTAKFCFCHRQCSPFGMERQIW